jgi:hypothetical protein
MLMLSPGLLRLFQRPYAGLAAARMVVRVLSVVVIPALAMLTVCCSITCTESNNAQQHEVANSRQHY